MRLYHIGDKVIAIHKNDQTIPASDYGNDVEITIVADNIELEVFKEEDGQSTDMSLFYKLPILDAEQNSSQQKELAIEKIRAFIATSVGDTESLLGTIADGQSILVAVALSDIVALSTTTDFAKYKKARLDVLSALSGDADLVKIASDALAKIQSGEAILTGSVKGLEATIAETLTRSTGVANALIAAAKAE